MYSYDNDAYRQRYDEKMAELRRDYQYPERRETGMAARWLQSVRSGWSRPRWLSPRRAPVYRP